MSILYAMLNPSLSSADVEKIWEEDIAHKERLCALIAKANETMEPRDAYQFIVNVLPLLHAF